MWYVGLWQTQIMVVRCSLLSSTWVFVEDATADPEADAAEEQTAEQQGEQTEEQTEEQEEGQTEEQAGEDNGSVISEAPNDG